MSCHKSLVEIGHPKFLGNSEHKNAANRTSCKEDIYFYFICYAKSQTIERSVDVFVIAVVTILYLQLGTNQNRF